VQDPDEAHGTEKIDVDGYIERRIETDLGGGVDNRVTTGDKLPAIVIETQPVDGHIATGHVNPALDLGVEIGSQLFSKTAERVIAEDFPKGTLARGGATTGADE